ncbi:hypothetical protein DDD_2427 [Nonlabens dokdonensis DSW-6]|uniref:Uncharacterized protein n=1 Tax=Nonlabens dokdonensis (strain DSM 17205 / KCTC 12402 / DSW-6) TaxID=592029 RepID=L7WBR3_NONDD|nr:hypothetical protein DDD_2427 [Nonlabens dokdonensis DSW-6]
MLEKLRKKIDDFDLGKYLNNLMVKTLSENKFIKTVSNKSTYI